MIKLILALLVVALVIGVIALGPMMLIWGINLMEVAAIPYTLNAWWGAFLIQLFLVICINSDKVRK